MNQKKIENWMERPLWHTILDNNVRIKANQAPLNRQSAAATEGYSAAAR